MKYNIECLTFCIGAHKPQALIGYQLYLLHIWAYSIMLFTLFIECILGSIYSISNFKYFVLYTWKFLISFFLSILLYCQISNRFLLLLIISCINDLNRICINYYFMVTMVQIVFYFYLVLLILFCKLFFKIEIFQLECNSVGFIFCK